jgi:carboxypeptidase Q
MTPRRTAVALVTLALSMLCPSGCRQAPASVSAHGASAPSSAPVIERPAAAPTEVAPQATMPPALVAAAEKIAAAAAGERTAWERLAWMADTYGHRLSGSAALESAIDWTLSVMREDGLEAVRREPVMVPRWVRGEERARIVAPIDRELHLLGLGGTVGTGKKALRAEVVVTPRLEDVKGLGAAAKGKIVLINQVMPPFDHEHQQTHYGTTVTSRSSGASEAARVGAAATLIRSVTARSLQSPHTGSLRYAEGVAKIPAAALSVEDAELLARLAARGPVTVELSLGAKTLPDALSGNAIGELRGRELPEEVVVIGGHIDSWDVGDGSSDDGSGCLMAMEAVRLLLKAGLRPRRTIRVVLFTNEENGLRGGIAYHAAHKAERHVAAIEADVGAGAPRGFGIAGADEAAIKAVQAYAPLFTALGADALEAGGGGADISPLTADGVLSLGLQPDVSGYFDLHHSAADTIDKIDPEHLERNAAALALMAYILAER